MILETGKTYRVKIDDCCIRGEFTSRLIDVLYQGEKVNVLDYGVELIFANGVQLVAHGGVELSETE